MPDDILERARRADGMPGDWWGLVSPCSRPGWVEIIDNYGRHLCMPKPAPDLVRDLMAEVERLRAAKPSRMVHKGASQPMPYPESE